MGDAGRVLMHECRAAACQPTGQDTLNVPPPPPASPCRGKTDRRPRAPPEVITRRRTTMSRRARPRLVRPPAPGDHHSPPRSARRYGPSYGGRLVRRRRGTLLRAMALLPRGQSWSSQDGVERQRMERLAASSGRRRFLSPRAIGAVDLLRGCDVAACRDCVRAAVFGSRDRGGAPRRTSGGIRGPWRTAGRRAAGGPGRARDAIRRMLDGDIPRPDGCRVRVRQRFTPAGWWTGISSAIPGNGPARERAAPRGHRLTRTFSGAPQDKARTGAAVLPAHVVDGLPGRPPPERWRPDPGVSRATQAPGQRFLNPQRRRATVGAHGHTHCLIGSGCRERVTGGDTTT